MHESLKANKWALSSVSSTQQDLFDHNVITHDVTASELCTRRAPKARCKMNSRESKGLAIAAQSQIVCKDNCFVVPSQSNSSKRYVVDLYLNTCTCQDFAENAAKCKHRYAVEYMLQRMRGEQLPEPEKRKTYRQEWHEYNLAATNEKARFLELLYSLCQNLEESPQATGRPRVPVADRTFAVAYKVYSTISSRRFTTDLREAKQRGYTSTVPTYVSVCRFLESEELTPVLHRLITESALPLKAVEQDFAVDSSGFSTCQFTRWFSEKYGSGMKEAHDWLKLHAMVGVTTHVITSVEISGRDSHDTNYFKPLVTHAAQHFNLREVSGDKAYATRANLRLVESVGAKPYIAFRSNVRGDSKCATWNRIVHYYNFQREEYMKHYHRRSNVESAFSMIKSRFGERLRSKTRAAQINELLCKVLCHNLVCLVHSMYELGVEVSFGTESPSVT
jgi:transposase